MSATVNNATAGEAVTAKQAVATRIKMGKPAPVVSPRTLTLGAIEIISELFQPRSSGDWASDSHTRTLAVGIKNGRESSSEERLPPVLVFWVGDGWACIDGHHRLAALKGFLKADAQSSVSVEVFSGSLEEAKLESTRCNSRNKLVMSAADKTEQAWRHLLAGDGTHKSIALACGVSTKSVSRMASVVRERGATPEGLEGLLGLHWWQARVLIEGRDAPTEPGKRDDVKRQAEALAKVIKNNRPELVCDALICFDPVLAEALMHQLVRKLSDSPHPFETDGLPQFPEDAHAEF